MNGRFGNVARWVGWIGTLLIAAWLLRSTLHPGMAGHGLHLIPFSEKVPALACLLARCNWAGEAGAFLRIDLLGNLAVFVPYGFTVALVLMPSGLDNRPGAGWRWWLKVGAAGLVLSLGIELAQLWIPGRVTDVDDLILNAAGALLGGALVVAPVMGTRYVLYRRLMHIS